MYKKHDQKPSQFQQSYDIEKIQIKSISRKELIKVNWIVNQVCKKKKSIVNQVCR